MDVDTSDTPMTAVRSPPGVPIDITHPDTGSQLRRRARHKRHCQLTFTGAPEMTDKTGAEVIDIIERFNFNLGSAIDCIARADGKTASGTIGDLERAQWYLEREIKRIKHYGESAVPSSQTSATRAASQVRQLGLSQQNGTVWQDRMGDKYRFSDGAWEYLTAGQDNWEPVRFPDILTDFGPYTAVADS